MKMSYVMVVAAVFICTYPTATLLFHVMLPTYKYQHLQLLSGVAMGVCCTIFMAEWKCWSIITTQEYPEIG